MARAIYCPKHGAIKPTHPEDAARGLFQRYTRGTAKHGGMVCDMCGCGINQGDECVAWCQPANMGQWEDEYISKKGQPITD